jgi:hypothetical protein
MVWSCTEPSALQAVPFSDAILVSLARRHYGKIRFTVYVQYYIVIRSITVQYGHFAHAQILGWRGGGKYTDHTSHKATQVV